jgi:hypothetical protein
MTTHRYMIGTDSGTASGRARTDEGARWMSPLG